MAHPQPPQPSRRELLGGIVGLLLFAGVLVARPWQPRSSMASADLLDDPPHPSLLEMPSEPETTARAEAADDRPRLPQETLTAAADETGDKSAEAPERSGGFPY